ncbi:anthranilate synthase component I family protein [Streptomyces sp. SID1034]|uniref:anthranilate synthase component I family protein n=1 Tax=Streptomyces sp. SID1034 TaxID=2690248 RepID=UPI00136A4B4F|nr:anthranilate synthase component I family protein [Streptomyces sp. SID1034]MYV93983.1 anthranilate synthase component I family protein [Streptomyces sp. SID1034]
MPESGTIGVRVTDTALPHHDPLDLYVRLRESLDADDVFLFESVDGADQDRRWAVVGFGRLAEIRVHDGYLEIDGAARIAEALAGRAVAAGMADHTVAAGAHRLAFGSADRMWELLSAAGTLFEVTSDVPATAYAFGFLTTFAYESAWHMESLPRRTKEAGGPDITLTLFRDTVWYDLADGSVRQLAAQSAAFADRPRRADAAAGAGFARDTGYMWGAGYAWGARNDGDRAAVPQAPAPLSVRDSVSRETFLGWAERCLEHIRVGDIYQIQIGHRIDVRTELTPVDVYRRLRARNPSPYMYLMPRAGRTLIGASPELFYRIEGDEITMRPIAGTARRCADPEENARRVKEMRESTKEQAEHIMLVDLCRNDIGRVTRPSTQPVDRLMAVETYSHVFHLVSTVTGRLEPGVDTWRALRATFPAGTMTGAPKVRAMEIIDALEQERRGSYAGAVGLVDVRGWTELALTIRTVEYDGETYSTQSSAGMVAQSEPESEWRETLAKMGAAYWALTGEELSS